MALVRYTLSMPRPSSHLFHVKVEAKGLPGDTADFVMPVWTPGSYKVRDFAKNVQEFSAGRSAWKKVDKSRWRVQAGGDVTVEYKVWAFELTVDTSHLDADHGYVNGASVFMYVDGHKDAPVEVVLKPARGWRVATGMERRGRVWTAPDYDRLVDSPVEMSAFREHAFRVRGVRHRLVIHGDGNAPDDRIAADVRKIVETEIRMMRHVPYPHYTFILHNANERGGGLEHLNSTSLQVPGTTYRPREKYLNFLELVAHEYFHTWNVKRIRPEQLGPFDYEREVYTSLLWVMEGITSYYDTLMPCRAKLATPEEYLRRVAQRIERYEEKPGRRRQSLSESSFDTWVKLYQRGENAVNSQMSYYEKGELVGLCLDLEIRRRTKNRKSLDDVMRLLYREWGREGRGFPEAEFKRASERVAGGRLDRFWADHVDGVTDVPWDRFLRIAGLRRVREPKKDGRGKTVAWLGITTQKLASGLRVVSVLEGSPAWKAGLSARDEIVAMDGARVNADDWERRMADRRPGDRIRFALFRGGFLREVVARAGSRDNVTPEIRPLARPTALQRRVYEGWTGAKWKRAKRKAKRKKK